MKVFVYLLLALVGIGVFFVVNDYLRSGAASGNKPLNNNAPVEYVVKYSVTGNSEKASITYTNSQGDIAQLSEQELPWELQLKVRSGFIANVVAQNLSEQDAAININISANDVLMKHTRSSGPFCIATSTVQL